MMIRTRTFCCFAIATMLALTSTAAAQSPPLSRTLEGAWTVTVVFDQQGLLPCAPAGALFTTITPGRGTVIAESCYASEGAGYGSWARTASNEFASVPLSERGDATPASPFASRLTAEIRRKEGRLHWGIEATRCLEPASAWFYANYTENLEVAPQPGLEPGTLRLTATCDITTWGDRRRSRPVLLVRSTAGGNPRPPETTHDCPQFVPALIAAVAAVLASCRPHLQCRREVPHVR